jgi:hypothetical protein
MRGDEKMGKWPLYVDPVSFAETVWQCDDEFTPEQLNQVINNWSDIVQTLLICLSEGESTDEILDKLDGDYYPLGDLANFLDNIEIKKEGGDHCARLSTAPGRLPRSDETL